VDYPTVNAQVWIHFTDDCTCKAETKIDCTCNKWFKGVVVEEKEECNAAGNSLFLVRYDEDDDEDDVEDEVEWCPTVSNDWWKTQQ